MVGLSCSFACAQFSFLGRCVRVGVAQFAIDIIVVCYLIMRIFVNLLCRYVISGSLAGTLRPCDAV